MCKTCIKESSGGRAYLYPPADKQGAYKWLRRELEMKEGNHHYT